jgi:hypothetical protein
LRTAVRLALTDIDALWGGTLTSLTLDPASWILRAQVETTNGTSRRYVLVLDEVVDLHATRVAPLPWTHAELTEVHVRRRPSSRLRDEKVVYPERPPRCRADRG